jgi:purine-binding chemotaxis protein CheW
MAQLIVCSINDRRCALPIESVRETMRALPIVAAPGRSPGVLGVATIRGVPTPVIDLGAWFACELSSPRWFVTISVGQRVAAVAVDEVLGIRSLAAAHVAELPPLLASADAAIVESVAAADADLVFVLSAARLIDVASEGNA